MLSFKLKPAFPREFLLNEKKKTETRKIGIAALLARV
jgi:hypothetical protein